MRQRKHSASSKKTKRWHFGMCAAKRRNISVCQLIRTVRWKILLASPALAAAYLDSCHIRNVPCDLRSYRIGRTSKKNTSATVLTCQQKVPALPCSVMRCGTFHSTDLILANL